MNYLERLKKFQDTQSCRVPKGTKAPLGTFGTKQEGTSREISTDAVLRAFVDLVRATAACDHQLLFTRGAIRNELDDQSTVDLLTATCEAKQAWAASIAQRLARRRIDPSWEAAL